MVRRQTQDEDVDRIAENLDINEGAVISDRDSFDLALDRYLQDNKLSTDSKDKIFNAFKGKNPNVSSDRIFKKAGGKDLSRDRQQTAKTVVKTKEEFIKKGARRVDFAGFDIKESEIRKLKLKKPPKEFDVAAVVKSKVVFAKRSSVTVKGKKIIVFRDQKGRFASVKK